MSRSGYSDDCDDPLASGRWMAQVASATRGKRGQAFLRELAEEMDAMDVKELIAEKLMSKDGGVCAIGVVCKKRGLDVSSIDDCDPQEVGDLVGIARQLAAEIAYVNDELGDRFICVETEAHVPGLASRYSWIKESPAERWDRVREWVGRRLFGDKK